MKANPSYVSPRILMAIAMAIGSSLYTRTTVGAQSESSEPALSAEAGNEAHGAEHELGHGNATETLESVTEFRTDLAIYTFVVFALLLLILGKFAWPPIVRALEERERRIADNIAAAEAKNEEAKQLLAQHEARLAAAADEVRGLLEEARRDAEHTKAQIVAEARQAAQAEHERAIRDVEQAKDVAMKQLAETSAVLAVQLASKVVEEDLSPGRQERLVREAVSRLTTTPSQN
jgi:F-type H+-transporting ATPase subunit b